jgi:hypothetical protein
VDTFQAKQDANRDNFTRIQVRVFALVDMRQFVVYHTKESNDNLFGSHQVVLLFAMFCCWLKESHNLLSLATSTFQLATVVINYLDSLNEETSHTYKIIKNADHSLSEKEWNLEFVEIITGWFKANFGQ